MLKKITAVLVGASIIMSASGAFAKSYDLISGNMDYRRRLISEPAFKTYVKTNAENYVYYGAKFEPRAGIYIGTPYDRAYPGIANAVNTEYDWFVPKDEYKNENCPRVEKTEKKSNHTVLKGYNLNFALPNSQVIEISDFSNYLYNKIDELAAMGEDILLIFGKEFNIDDNFNDPELFKRCFRFVADYAHTKENIAMVWAPNDTGGLDTTLEEFYPGDEYVDWVGCSMYTMPYFQGNPDADDGANMSFIMGEYANPSMRAKLIHSFLVRNNIKKPVMITEGGVGYESPSGIDYTDWACHQLRLYYSDLCRAYPEFKCIISFNQFVYPGDLYRYDIAKNPILLAALQDVTQDSIYLKKYPDSAPYSYTELFNGMIFTDRVEISSYAYIPKKQNLVVRYLLDGQWIAERNEPPYELSAGSDLIPYGWHTLTCEIYDGTKIAQKKDYWIALHPSENNYAYADEADDKICAYADMSGKPNEMRNAVGFLTMKGILNGTDGKNFSPDSKISRAEMAAILMRIAEAEETNTPSGLTDVTEENWYWGAVNAAVKAGLITGYDDMTFRGGNAITRDEFVTILSKIVLKEKNAEVPEITLDYSDELSGWAYDYIKTAKHYNLILERKDGIFCGSSEVTRGDAAIMAKRLYDLIK